MSSRSFPFFSRLWTKISGSEFRIETTALGAAFLAGLGAGVYSGLDDIKSFWRLDRRFEPAMKSEQRKTLLAGWFEALGRIKSSD